MKQLSIIIPYHNDIDTLIGTIESLYATIDVDGFEVIIVNDASTEPPLPKSYSLKPNMKHIDHFVNLGVGQAFDSGVRMAESPNIILMGADIRFEPNGWASRMLNILNKEDKSLVCTTCGSTKNNNIYYGADVIFFVENKNLSKRHPQYSNPEYKSILEGKWRPRTGRGVYPVPSLMGAFYGVKKTWYDFIRGFQLHYKWGVLEPYISLKSWILGGKVLVDSDSITYHIFNRNPKRETDTGAFAYNQLMTAGTVFGNYGVKYALYLADNPTQSYEVGAKMRMERIDSMGQMAHYIQQNSVSRPEMLEESMVNLSYHYNVKDSELIDPREVEKSYF